MRKKALYLYVTADEYELPLAVADTIPALARKVGKTEKSIKKALKRENKSKPTQFRKVILDDEDTETIL